MSVPLPIPHLPYKEQDTLVLLTMVLWGEARNQTHEGLTGVAWVIRNRVLDAKERFGHDWKSVILKPKQFSCLNPDDPQAAMMLYPQRYSTPEIWRRCAEVAEGVFRGDLADPTSGANHYYTVRRPRWAKAWPPRWAGSMTKTVVLGDHQFLRV